LDNSTAKSIGCSHSREFKLIVQLRVKETWFEPSRFTNKVFGCFGQNRRDRRFEEADTNISAPTSNHARTNHSRCSQSFGGALEGHQIVEGGSMPIRRGATGQKGRRGERGIPGPPGAAGTAGVEGSQGREGPRGETGSQGPEGAAGPAGKIPDVVKVAEQLEYIDRSVENIYREMGNHITRMTQLQRELDALRDHVRRLATKL
jgi:hypothetical protein